MRLNPKLMDAQARALIDQLLEEPIVGSETAKAIVVECR